MFDNKKELKYRIGLDIGVASVGWAVLQHDDKGEPVRIIDRGVRVFEAAENPKDGSSLMAEKREARSIRRRLRRKQHRLARIKNLICHEFNFTSDNLKNIFEGKNEKRRDVYVVRFEALERKLGKEDWARLLVHLAQKRGFKSNRRNEKLDAEGGKLKKAVELNEQLMAEKGYRTVGELLYKETRKQRVNENREISEYFETRNSSGDYKFTFSRMLIEKEIDIIFQLQRNFGSLLASENFLQEYKNIFAGQRNFDEGPGYGSRFSGAGGLIKQMVGTCTFENIENGKPADEPRAPKNSYSFERFMLIQKINNIKIKGNGTVSELSNLQKGKIITEAYKEGKLTFKDIRKLLEMGDYSTSENEKPEFIFNFSIYGQKTKEKIADASGKLVNKTDEKGRAVWRFKTFEECEKEIFVELKGYSAIKKCLDKIEKNYILKLSADEIDTIATALTLNKSDERLRSFLIENKISEAIVSAIIESAPNFDKFGHLSVKAIKNILPHLESGLIYDKACEAAGYSFKNQNEKGEKTVKLKFDEISKDIRTPVVKRAVSQALKVINGIVDKYGSPEFVCIELAREMAKNFNERRELQASMEENQATNKKLMDEIKKLISPAKPSGQDLEKYKLWKEQQEMCAYSGQHISIEDLFKPGFAEVDHIIPYSKCFDNSYKNKVVVKVKYNQEKANRIPMDYIKTKGETELKRYKIWVETFIKNRSKKFNLLATEIDEKEMSQRNLQDTQHSSKLVADFIRNNLFFKPNNQFGNKVLCVNGAVTSYVRKRTLGSLKNRDTDNHHAEDAILIACCSKGLEQRIAEYEKTNRENFYDKSQGKWISLSSGEVFNTKKELIEDRINNSLEFPKPWQNFREEFKLWFSENPQSEANLKLRDILLQNYNKEEKINPLFVSRMSNHKITGAAHKETMFKTALIKGTDYIIKKIPIKELKLCVNAEGEVEIENYYNQKSDSVLYNALLKELQKFNGDAKKAFENGFKKPALKGGAANFVNSVKVISKPISSYVKLDKIGAVAANGDMIRIDVFAKNNKRTRQPQFYFVPIYIADFKKKELPNVSTNGEEMTAEFEFKFSLFAKDLILIKNKKGISAKKEEVVLDSNGEPQKDSNGKTLKKVNVIKNLTEPTLLYYTNADISTSSISCIAHNKEFFCRGIGIMSLEVFEKWEVDILGNVKKAAFVPRQTKTLHGRRNKDKMIDKAEG